MIAKIPAPLPAPTNSSTAPAPTTPAAPAPPTATTGQKALALVQNLAEAVSQKPAPAPATPVAATPASDVTIPLSLADLSSDQVTRGLKEALAKGLQQAVGSLGKTGGFLTNLNVKIPMPEKMQSVEKALRTLGQDRLADEFITTMNQAAELAVPAAAEVFAGGLQRMTVDDAKGILSGPKDAGTQFFRRTTEAELTQKFLPIVQKATAKSGATAVYKQVTEKAKLAGPFVTIPSLDLDTYVTGKALDGLFKMVAAEEKRIRDNPVARSTDLLKSVFGALQR